jgi:RNA 3'-terminal phosphate cyclase (ATP)
MILIDGTLGEGGGQILRTALSLSAITGKAFRLINIRRKRKKPGLRHQHLACVNAAAEICQAHCTGNALESTELEFSPGTIQAGNYFYNIPTAGSAMQVIQTVLPILSHAEGASKVTVRGGTHNPGAPPFEFFTTSFLPLLNELGLVAALKLLKYGFYPVGGGEIVTTIQPRTQSDNEFSCCGRGELDEMTGEILISWLPLSIAERESKIIQSKLGLPAAKTKITEVTNSPGPGNVILIRASFGERTHVFTAFGWKGKPAEQVAAEACEAYFNFHRSGAAMDEHLTNQILLYLASGKGGAFTAERISLHTQTNIEIIKQFLETNIEVKKKDEGCYEVQVKPIAGN